MMANLKIALVGGGSYNWGPVVLGNILGTEYLSGSHVVLHDLSPEPLGLMHRLTLKYKAQTGSSVTFEQTTDQAAALDGAHYVVVTIAVGGLKAFRSDLEIPEKFGIFHTVGDTAGPAGLSRALRNVPVFLDIARNMERLCPTAWMLNCSNPLSALTRVVNKETGIRALGVCHGVPNRVRMLASFFGVLPGEYSFVNSGIDHCAWFTEFVVKGRPADDILTEMGIDAWLRKRPAQAREDVTFAPLYDHRCGFLLGRQLGVLPAIGDRHLVEFFPTFLRGLENVERYGLTRTPISAREQGYADARARLKRWLKDEEPLPPVKGGEAQDNVAGWMAALSGGPAVQDNLNAPNTGQVPQLPEGAIVETRGILDGTGVRPLVSPLPPQLEAVLRPQVLREELTVEAAVEGSFEKALAVMVLDPLVGEVDIARPLLEDLISATRDWLPQFA